MRWPPYLRPQLRQTVDWWIKSIGTHLQMCGELSLLIRRARERPVGQWMAFNGPGDAHVAFSIFWRKKKRKSNCSLIGRRLLTNGGVQTLIEKNPLKKVRLLRIKGHEALTASAVSTLIGGWFIASRWAIQSAPPGSSVNKSCWLDWQHDTLVRHQSYALSCENLNFIAQFHWAFKIRCSNPLVDAKCRSIIKYYDVQYIQ